jgi:hypothetical protein
VTPQNDKLIYTLGTSTRSLEELAQRRRVTIFVPNGYPGAATAALLASSWRDGDGR